GSRCAPNCLMTILPVLLDPTPTRFGTEYVRTFRLDLGCDPEVNSAPSMYPLDGFARRIRDYFNDSIRIRGNYLMQVFLYPVDSEANCKPVAPERWVLGLVKSDRGARAPEHAFDAPQKYQRTRGRASI